MKFSDADPMGRISFDLFGYEPLWDEMADRFGGKEWRMGEVERFVIEETDYLPKHARALLKIHEERGDIKVVPVAGYKRRKGTFPADKVRITFHTPNDGSKQKGLIRWLKQLPFNGAIPRQTRRWVAMAASYGTRSDRRAMLAYSIAVLGVCRLDMPRLSTRLHNFRAEWRKQSIGLI